MDPSCKFCGKVMLKPHNRSVSYWKTRKFCDDSCKRGYHTDHQRVLDRLVVDPVTGCWMWTGTITTDGYGQFSMEGKHVRLSRYMYEYHNGPIPEGFVVMHSCDTPACGNPEHLVSGTQYDNMQDKRRKGRCYRPRGTLQPMHKLLPADAEAIRKDTRSGVTIAKVYGISQSLVSAIRNGKRWNY